MIDLPTAALKIALDCHLSDTLARLAAGIMLRENPKLDPLAVNNHNANGTADRGYTQVNDVNYGWLSLAMHRPINAQTIFEPCVNLEAGLRVQFKLYNGNPPPTVAADYTTRAWNTALAIDAIPRPQEPPPTPLPPPCAPAWDAWALAACSKPRAPVPQPSTVVKDPHAN